MLSPLIFIMVINDLPLRVRSAEINLYADDTPLTSSANCESVDRLQSSLIKIQGFLKLSIGQPPTSFLAPN